MPSLLEYVPEETFAFGCEGEQLFGIISSPPEGMTVSGVGVVIVVGGPQYRVGSHRQFVHLARALASQGHHCLRFDYRGMGDSTGAARDFLVVQSDIEAAITALRKRRPDVRRLVLWGLCDGASAILLFLQHPGNRFDVEGVVLANPWVRSVLTHARTRVKYYYLRRLGQREFWKKLLLGRVALNSLIELLRTLRRMAGSRFAGAMSENADFTQSNFQDQMAAAWASFPGAVLLLLSEEDFTAKEFLEHVQRDPLWSGALQRPQLLRQDCSGVDHTFSVAGGKRLAAEHTNAWLRSLIALD